MYNVQFIVEALLSTAMKDMVIMFVPLKAYPAGGDMILTTGGELIVTFVELVELQVTFEYPVSPVRHEQLNQELPLTPPVIFVRFKVCAVWPANKVLFIYQAYVPHFDCASESASVYVPFVQVRIVELFARLPVTGLIAGTPRTQAVLLTVNAAELFIVLFTVPS